MLKVRLMRIGTKKRPFYRVVVVDERAKRNGAFIEIVGTYNPLTEPKEIILKQDRIDDWVRKGAQISHGLLRVMGKAPQKPPRKPKKEPEEAKTSAVSQQSSDSNNKEEAAEGTKGTNGTGGTKGTEEIDGTEKTKEEAVVEEKVEIMEEDKA